MFLFRKLFLIFYFLIWILQHHDESTAFGIQCNVGSSINISPNETCDRVLRVKEKESNSKRRIKNTDLKERIKTLLDEDDNTFAEKLNAIVNDDEFRKQMNVLIHKNTSGKMLFRSTQEKGLKRNFYPYNSRGNYEENTDQFENYDSFEDIFHEFERESNHKAKPVNGIRRNKSNIQESVEKEEEEEYDIAINISQNLRRNKSLQSLFYDYEYKGEPQSWIDRKIHKFNSKLDSEIIRFLRIMSRRTRIYKGKGLSGYLKSLCSKYRVFSPLAAGVVLSILTMHIAFLVSNPIIFILFSLITFNCTLVMGTYYIIRLLYIKYYF
ncbi:Plasmodium exported protein, unknown function [Plasmodium knowlesi strain H]|uniref:Pv-fam-d protein n=3 Tax=Plasmodium knowlesi TaxID=5850 RepID=A0A1A7W3I8_PLAKH|nr:Plasmodium exported protein, unknown function [Plasmodium knowlesi strain H]OTN63903.1 Uncharacterized protein PKNOH_S140218000 [Plasmodium knowlesi]CAA9990608.1 Plasmodium exported protein, unknown function [Plasmodium knowlesi strain H]SBO26063.1 Plasmodium exported protein, unknown function [Plasmodium knowlesi strain H]SBO28751.1 Plasmodium exported protein, unknown function [Plasmodium knowlesi strain H]VVS80082.1 Plasmodium exported protein, unknown function [Plasmodium knowlesi strai